MSNTYSLTGANGSYGAAAVRARKQHDSSDQQAREDRIAELRRQYLEGTYQVDARELSAALIRRHLAKDS